MRIILRFRDLLPWIVTKGSEQRFAAYWNAFAAAVTINAITVRVAPAEQKGTPNRTLRRSSRRVPSDVRHLGMRCGGEEGIRTLETVSRLHTFQACAFDHSATSPRAGLGDAWHGRKRVHDA